MIITVLILSVLLGSGIGYVFNQSKNLSRLLLTFSGAFLLTATILEIFPEIYTELGNTSYNLGLFILLGVFLQIVLEAITKGAEHGHFHHNKSDVFPISVFIGLMLHAIMEGIPLHEDVDNHLLYTIAIHKLPVAVVLSGFVIKMTESRIKRIVFMAAFALASPIGYYLGDYIPKDATIYFLAIVSGIFLHISTVIIFESSDGHNLRLKKIMALTLGFVIAYLTLGHHH